MQTAKTKFTSDGTITDPESPAKRIKVKDGVYSTADPDEIAFLQGHADFGKKNEDGFHVRRELTLEEEVKALAQRHNTTPEKIKGLVGAE